MRSGVNDGGGCDKRGATGVFVQEERSGVSRVAVGVGLLVLLVLCGGVLTVVAGSGWFFLQRSKELEVAQIGVQKVNEERDAMEAQHQEAAKDQLMAVHAAALDQARAEYEAGNYENTLTMLDKLLLEDPKYVDAWVLHGRALAKLKDRSRAIQDFTRALTLDENRQDAYDYRAFLYFQEEMYADAMEDIAHLLALDPNNGRAYKLRSDCYFQTGEMEKARNDAKKSCELGYEEGCTAAKRLKAR